MGQLFKVDANGVHAGEGSNTRNTNSNLTFESNIPVNFYIDTTLPNSVSYNPDWVIASSCLYSGVTEVDEIRFKKIGAHVFVDGCFTINVSNTNLYPIAFMTLPPTVRPQFDHYTCGYTEKSNSYASLRFSTDGILSLEIVGQLASLKSGSGLQSGSITFGVSTDYWCSSSDPLTELYVSVPFDTAASNGVRWTHTSSTTPFFGYIGTTSNISYTDTSGKMELHSTSASSGNVNGCWYTTTPVMINPEYAVLNASLTTDYSKSADKSVTIGLVPEDFSSTLTKSSTESSFTNLGDNGIQATPVNFASVSTQDIACPIPESLDYSKRYYIFVLITSTKFVSGVSNNSTGCTKVWFT